MTRLVLARGRGNCALHCCKELIRCTGGRGRLTAGCRAVIRINRQRAGVSHTVSSTALTHAGWYSHTASSTATARELDASKAQTFAAFSLLLADKGPRNAQSTSLAFSLLLTKGSAQTNKHPPSPSTTAKPTQATCSALSRVGLTSAFGPFENDARRSKGKH